MLGLWEDSHSHMGGSHGAGVSHKEKLVNGVEVITSKHTISSPQHLAHCIPTQGNDDSTGKCLYITTGACVLTIQCWYFINSEQNLLEWHGCEE